MKSFVLNNKEWSMPESWSEINLRIYTELAKLEENKTEYLLGELYLLKVIEVLCGAESGDLDDLTMEMVSELSQIVGFVVEQPKWENTKHIQIEGKDYSFPKDLNKLTIGEYVSIKTLQENYTTQAEFIPWLLAIILRPAEKVVDPETGEEFWKQEKFKAENLEWRKELLMSQPVFNLLGPINFFLSGSGLSMTATEASMEKV